MDSSFTNIRDLKDRHAPLIKHTWYGSTQPGRQKTDEEIKAEISLRLRKRERVQGESVPPRHANELEYDNAGDNKNYSVQTNSDGRKEFEGIFLLFILLLLFRSF